MKTEKKKQISLGKTLNNIVVKISSALSKKENSSKNKKDKKDKKIHQPKGKIFLQPTKKNSNELNQTKDINENIENISIDDFDKILDESFSQLSSSETDILLDKDIQKNSNNSEKNIEEDNIDNLKKEDSGFLYNSSNSNSYDSISNIFNNNESALNKFDDIEMIKYLQSYYPDLSNKELTDVQTRNIIIKILNNQAFMKKYLEKYDIDIFYFFRLMYRFYSHIFNATFVKKIQKNLKYKKYIPKKASRKNKKRKLKSKKSNKIKKYDF